MRGNGGEEFAIILPGADINPVRSQVARLRHKAAAKLPIAHPSVRQKRLTVSNWRSQPTATEGARERPDHGLADKPFTRPGWPRGARASFMSGDTETRLTTCLTRIAD